MTTQQRNPRVAQARQLAAQGFYDTDEVLDVTAEKLLDVMDDEEAGARLDVSERDAAMDMSRPDRFEMS